MADLRKQADMAEPTAEIANLIELLRAVSASTPMRRPYGASGLSPGSLYALFWARVDIRGYEDCWPWRTGRGGDGYGMFNAKAGEFGIPSRIALRAHRVAFYIVNGRWPDPMALHGCDNRRCCNAVNPEHIHEGNGELNMHEMAERGRAHWLGKSDERHPRAKLTNDEVHQIRERYAMGGITQAALGAEYGVTQVCISAIVRGEHFRESA